jgi:elongation factor Ts
MSAALIKELRERTGLGLLECKKALSDSNGDIDQAIDNLRKSSGIKAAKKAGRVAADGVVAAKISDDEQFGILVEVNSETDFVARDDGFLDFVGKIVDRAFELKVEDVAQVLDGSLEKDREALVQKIGENISVRRIASLEVDHGIVGVYVHGNSRIGVLVGLSNKDTSLARDIAMHVAAVNPKVLAAEDMPKTIIDAEKEIYTSQALDSGKSEDIAQKMVEGRIKKFLAENSLLQQSFVKNPDQTIGELIAAHDASVKSFIRYEVGEGIDVEKTDFAEEVAAQLKQ